MILDLMLDEKIVEMILDLMLDEKDEKTILDLYLSNPVLESTFRPFRFSIQYIVCPRIGTLLHIVVDRPSTMIIDP